MGSDVSSSCFFSTSSTLSSELCFESVEAILNFRVGKRTNCNLGVYFQSHAVLWTSNVKAPISLAKPGIKPSQVRHQRFPYFLNVPGLATMRIDLYRCELISNWTTQICHKTGQNFQKKKKEVGYYHPHFGCSRNPLSKNGCTVMGSSRVSSNKFARMGIGPVAQKRNVAIAIAGAKTNKTSSKMVPQSDRRWPKNWLTQCSCNTPTAPF